MMGTCNHCWCTHKGDRGALFIRSRQPFRTRRPLLGQSLSWLGVFFSFCCLSYTRYTDSGGIRRGLDEKGVGSGERKGERGLLNSWPAYKSCVPKG